MPKKKEEISGCWAIFYNLMEPMMVGLSLGTSLQLANVGTLAYCLVDLAMIGPFIGTKDATRISVKQCGCIVKMIIAVCFMGLKAVCTA